MGISRRNRLMVFASVICSVCGDTADVLIGWDLVQKFWQHGCVTDVAASDFDGPYFQWFFVDAHVYLTPDTAFGASVLACIPLAFTFGLDPVLSTGRFSGPLDPR